jgi:hypothetical protein
MDMVRGSGMALLNGNGVAAERREFRSGERRDVLDQTNGGSLLPERPALDPYMDHECVGSARPLRTRATTNGARSGS